MKSGIIATIALVLMLQTVSAQSLALDITLGPNDVTAFNLPGLFATAAKENKLILPKTTASSPQAIPGLGQQAASYTSSHPAAFVQTFGQIQHAISALPLKGDQTIDAYSYYTKTNILSLVSQGTFYQLKYDQNTYAFTVSLTIPVDAGKICTAIDSTDKIAVVGCLADDQKSAMIYAVKDGKLAENPLNLPFDANQEIKGGLRVDINSRSDEIAVFGDVYRRSGAEDPQQIAIYYVSIDDDTGAMTLNNALTSITMDDEAKTTVTFDKLNEVYLMDGIENPEVRISGVVTGTGKLELYSCTVDLDSGTKIATFNACKAGSIAQRNVANGRLKYFPSDISFVLLFDADQSTVSHCLYDKDTEGYTDCATTNRSLPYVSGNQQAADLYVTLTFTSNTMGATFKNSETGQIWAIANLARYGIDQDTEAVSFDHIIEANPKAIFIIEKGQASVFFEETYKTYAALPSPMLQISAYDLPAPSANSDVTIKRLLIQITRNQPPASIWVKVVALEDMFSWMGFTDNLPDFGGLAGGYALANIDRSWLYGNDLAFSIKGDDLTSPIALDRMDFEFTRSDSVVFTKLFVQNELMLVAQDANKLYSYKCRPGPKNNNNCDQDHSFSFPADSGMQIVKVFDSVSHPDTLQSTSTIAYLVDKDGKDYLYYIWRADLTKSALVTLKYAVRDLHIINYQETLMVFMAPTDAENSKNVLVQTCNNTPEGIAALKDLTSITPETVKLPSESTFAPSNLISCGHNDYVIEYLSNTGYIVKLNVLGIEAGDIELRANVRIVNPADTTFVAAGFCPMGDEFILWDKDFKSVFSTSTVTDNTAYNFDIGYSSISAIACAPKSASAGIWFKNNNFDNVMATIFGNQYNTAHSKVHSIVQLAPETKADFAGTFSMTPSGIAQVWISGGKTFVKHMILGGPYVLTGFADKITNPVAHLEVTAGGQTRTLDLQLNIADVDRTVRIGNIKQNITLDKGDLNLEAAADIIGHVYMAYLLNVPPSLQTSITLQQRLSPITLPSAENADVSFDQILAANGLYTLYLGESKTNGQLTISLRGKGVTKDVVTPFDMVTSVDGFFDKDQAVIAFLWKSGGAYSVTIYFLAFTGSDPTLITKRLDSGYMETLRIIRVPGSNPTYALFVSSKMNNMWLVYKAKKEDGSISLWDTIPNCFNLWTIRSDDVGMAFFNGQRDTTFNIYVMPDATVAKGTIQTGISFSGHNDEFKDVSCTTYNTYSFECAFVTWGPTNTFMKTTFAKNWTIPINSDSGLPAITSRSLYAYADMDDVAGSYTHAKVIPGYVLLKSLDRTYELYKTDVASQVAQGYIYARVPALAPALEGDRLRYSVLHDPLEDERDFALVTDGTAVSIQRLNPKAANAEGVEAFAVQPLTLKISTVLNDADAASMIQIDLGGSKSLTKFNVTSFFTPKPAPGPAPEPAKKLTWLWILLGVVGLVIVAIIVVMVVNRRKEYGAEDDAYHKNEPFVDEDAGSIKQKRKGSDEFS